jgi:hypothetical protein
MSGIANESNAIDRISILDENTPYAILDSVKSGAPCSWLAASLHVHEQITLRSGTEMLKRVIKQFSAWAVLQSCARRTWLATTIQVRF